MKKTQVLKHIPAIIFFGILVFPVSPLLNAQTIAQIDTTNQQEQKALRLSIHMGQDKYQHLTISAFLVAGQLYFLQEQDRISQQKAIRIAVSTTALLGIAKEGYDHFSQKGYPSLRDLLANAAGIGAAILLFSIK